MIKSFLNTVLATSCFLLAAHMAHAANRDVCSTCGYTTIQDAINNSINGDTVRVAGGSYTEEISFSSASLDIRLEGGYNSTFTARNSETILNGRFQIGFSSASSVAIDRFTIVNASSQAIYVSGTLTDLTVTNCIIHDASSFGIYAYNPGNITIDSTEIYASAAFGGIGIQRLSASKAMTITNNVLHTGTCATCIGIYMTSMLSADLIEGNDIFNNFSGISLLFSDSSQAPLIANNRIYQNSQYGLVASHGSPIIKNNYFYKNGVSGFYNYSVDSPQILNNLFASNGPYGFGVQLNIGSGSPLVRNNIFYYEFHGLYFDSGISVLPSSVDHNVFFHDQILDYRDLRSGYNETPGDYNDINHFSWSSSNLVIDPRFVDADNDNYTLRSDSFLIDEGDPSSDYSAEATPNAGRINIGPQGGSAAANTSPASPTISNISCTQAGNDIQIAFDTNTATHDLWVKLEYYDGSTYHLIAPANITGDSYSLGYYSGRIASGNGQSLLWNGAVSSLGAGSHSIRIRASVEHGSASASVSSSDFTVGAVDTATPTTTPTPSPTQTSTATATPTSTPSPTATNTASLSATPTSTPITTQTPALETTATPSPSSTPAALKLQAQECKITRGDSIRLPYQIQDSSSGVITISSSIRIFAKTISIGRRKITAPIVDSVSIDFGRHSIPPGRWRYCSVAKNSQSAESKSCSFLRVLRSRSHRSH